MGLSRCVRCISSSRKYGSIHIEEMAIQKTTVEIDLDALGEAAENLGTRGIKQTVNAALDEVNRRAALGRAAAYVREGAFHAPDEETWAALRDART